MMFAVKNNFHKVILLLKHSKELNLKKSHYKAFIGTNIWSQIKLT